MKTVILFLIVTIFSVSVTAQTFNREQALKIAIAAQMMTPNSKVFSIAATGSMKPMMDEHCLVVMVNEPFENIGVHDVVIYTQTKSHQNIIHRVMEKRKDGKLWTLGDNNKRPDNEFVTSTNYVGKVCTVIYYRGEPINSGLIAAASR